MLLPQNALFRIGDALKASALVIVGMAVEIREGFSAIYEPFAHVDGFGSFIHAVAGLRSLEVSGLAIWLILLLMTLIYLIAGILKLLGKAPAETLETPGELAVSTDPKPPRHRSRLTSGGDAVAAAPVVLPSTTTRKPRAKRKTTPLRSAGEMVGSNGKPRPTA